MRLPAKTIPSSILMSYRSSARQARPGQASQTPVKCCQEPYPADDRITAPKLSYSTLLLVTSQSRYAIQMATVITPAIASSLNRAFT